MKCTKCNKEIVDHYFRVADHYWIPDVYVNIFCSIECLAFYHLIIERIKL